MPNNFGNILVADDNIVLIAVLSEILRERGYAVRATCDGLSALAQIRTQTPDVLLSDLNMPGMSGFELLSIVRRRYPTIRVIAMSGSYSGTDVPTGVAADAFYEKGTMSVDRLMQMVNTVRDEPELHLARTETPIWIPRLPMDSLTGSSVLLACPECLRAYPYSVNNLETLEERTCPRCLHRTQLAMVPAARECDTTLPHSQRQIEL